MVVGTPNINKNSEIRCILVEIPSENFSVKRVMSGTCTHFVPVGKTFLSSSPSASIIILHEIALGKMLDSDWSRAKTVPGIALAARTNNFIERRKENCFRMVQTCFHRGEGH